MFHPAVYGVLDFCLNSLGRYSIKQWIWSLSPLSCINLKMVICTPYHIDQAMKARYNYRIYSKNHQLEPLAKAMGCARVVWNDALWLYKKAEIEGTDRPKNISSAESKK